MTNTINSSRQSPKVVQPRPLADTILREIMSSSELDYLDPVTHATVRVIHAASARRVSRAVVDAAPKLADALAQAAADSGAHRAQIVERAHQQLDRLMRERSATHGILIIKQEVDAQKQLLDAAIAELQGRIDRQPSSSDQEHKAASLLKKVQRFGGSLWVRLHIPLATFIITRRARRAGSQAVTAYHEQAQVRFRQQMYREALKAVEQIRDDVQKASEHLAERKNALLNQQDQATTLVTAMRNEQGPFLGELLPGNELDQIADSILRDRLATMAEHIAAHNPESDLELLNSLVEQECTHAVDNSGQAPTDLTQYLLQGRVNITRLFNSLNILAAPLTIVDSLAVPGQPRHQLLLLEIPGGEQNPLTQTIRNLVQHQGTVLRIHDNHTSDRITLLSYERFLSSIQIKPLMDSERAVAHLMTPAAVRTKAVLFDPVAIVAVRPILPNDPERADRILSLALALGIVGRDKSGAFGISDPELTSRVPVLGVHGAIAQSFAVAASKLAVDDQLRKAIEALVDERRKSAGEAKVAMAIRLAMKQSRSIAGKASSDRMLRALRAVLDTMPNVAQPTESDPPTLAPALDRAARITASDENASNNGNGKPHAIA